MEALKPCPFCGADAKPRKYSEYAKRIAKANKMPLVPMVQCTGCGAMVSFDPEHDHWPTYAQQAANEYWNQRTERTCKPVRTKDSAIACSLCGGGGLTIPRKGQGALRNYCPNCGAKVVE